MGARSTEQTTPREVGHRAAAGDGQQLRELLLDAAEAQLVERGSMQSVSLRQVARDVGVSPTAVYLHFSDKDDLFLNVCSRRFEAFAVLLRDARAGLDTPGEQLRASGKAYVRFGLEHPEQYAVLFGSMPMETVVERLAEEEMIGLQALRELAEVIGQGVQAGEFRPVDPFAAAISLWSLVHGMVFTVGHGTGTPKEVDPDALVDLSLELILNGLRAGDG